MQWTNPTAGWNGGWRRSSTGADVTIPFGHFRLSPGAERGTAASPDSGDTPYSRFSLRAGLTSKRATLYARGESGRGVAGHADRMVRRLSAGGSLQPRPGTMMRFQISDSATDAPWLEGLRWVSATVDERLPWSHHLVASYRQRSGSTALLSATTAYRLDYVVPLAVPLRERPNNGRVTVRLRNEETGQPQPRVLVQLGKQSLLTDARGIADFTRLTPGDYVVTVAPASLPANRTIVPAVPLKVTVADGRRTEIAAQVVRFSRVTGRVQRFTPSSGGLFAAAGAGQTLTAGDGLPGVTLELTQRDDRRLVTTDAAGAFDVDAVPPGEWQVRVASIVLPAFYRLERSELSVVVRAGDTTHLIVRVVPKAQVP